MHDRSMWQLLSFVACLHVAFSQRCPLRNAPTPSSGLSRKSRPPPSLLYASMMDTHVSPRASRVFNTTTGEVSASQAVFAAGATQRAHAWLDFDSPIEGTAGLTTLRGTPVAWLNAFTAPNATDAPALHVGSVACNVTIDTRDWRALQRGERPFLTVDCVDGTKQHIDGFTTCTPTLNATLATVTPCTLNATVSRDSVCECSSTASLAGVISVASLYLGPAARVQVQGDIPLLLLSRSSVIVDTAVHARPGSLGGAPGARYSVRVQGTPVDARGLSTAMNAGGKEVDVDFGGEAAMQALWDSLGMMPCAAASTSACVQRALQADGAAWGASMLASAIMAQQGAGASPCGACGATRTRLYTVILTSQLAPPRYRVVVGAATGQTIKGMWRLCFQIVVGRSCAATRALPASAEADDVRRAIIEDIAGIGDASVTRLRYVNTSMTPRGVDGYEWTVTLLTTDATAPAVSVSSDQQAPLNAVQLVVYVTVLSMGGNLRGNVSFTFRNATVAAVNVTMSPDDMATSMMTAWAGVGVARVRILEHPTPACTARRAALTAFPSDTVPVCRPMWIDASAPAALRVLYVAVDTVVSEWVPSSSQLAAGAASEHESFVLRSNMNVSNPTLAIAVEGLVCMPVGLTRPLSVSQTNLAASVPRMLCHVANTSIAACSAASSVNALMTAAGAAAAAWLPQQLLTDILTPHARPDRGSCIAPILFTQKYVYNATCTAPACMPGTVAVSLHSFISAIGGAGGVGRVHTSNDGLQWLSGGSGGAAGALDVWEFAALMDASLRSAATASSPLQSPFLSLKTSIDGDCTLQWQHARANLSVSASYSDDVSADGAGGAGGAALAFVGGTDIIFGPNSAISCVGEGGRAALRAGGGGAGGTVVLSAPGIVSVQGYVGVHGGYGGDGMSPLLPADPAALHAAAGAVLVCFFQQLQRADDSVPACAQVHTHFGIAGAGGRSGSLQVRSAWFTLAPAAIISLDDGGMGTAPAAQLAAAVNASTSASSTLRAVAAFLRFVCADRVDVAWVGLPSVVNASTSLLQSIAPDTLAFVSMLASSRSAWLSAAGAARGRLRWLCGAPPQSSLSAVDSLAVDDTYVELDYDTNCAMDTPGCLHLRTGTTTTDASRFGVIVPVMSTGPTSTALVVSAALRLSATSLPPSRISAHVRIRTGNASSHCGLHIALLSSNASTAIVGAALVDGAWYHDAGYAGPPQREIAAAPRAPSMEWQRVDLMLRWETVPATYSLRVDGVSLTSLQPFLIQAVEAVGVFVIGTDCDAWVDELFVGADDGMGFECPLASSTGEAVFAASPQTDWNPNDVGPASQAWPMQHHDSHLSARADFAHPWHAGLVDFDGHPVRAFLADFDSPRNEASASSQQLALSTSGQASLPSLRPYNSSSGAGARCGMLGSVGGFASRQQAGAWADVGTAAAMPCSGTMLAASNATRRGVVHAGSLTTVLPSTSTGTRRQAAAGARTYWYMETDNQLGWDTRPFMRGGIGACSTTDMITWRNDGIVLHWANITDGAAPSNVGENRTYDARVERPRVLRNTNESASVNCSTLTPRVQPYNSSNASSACGFVMWAFAWNAFAASGNASRNAVVAVSASPAGPFYFLRVDRPDGNDTVDFTVWQPGAADAQASGSRFPAVALRTFYATTTALMPGAVMQPIWQSVQVSGSAANNPDFALNYHRAFYHERYDSPTDTYLQAWRMEDKPWSLSLGSLQETFDDVSGNFTLTSSAGSTLVASYAPADRQTALSTYVARHAYVSIRGQGRPTPIHSRFLDPLNSANSAWMPSSVPAVKAQPWSANYRDKNIADNPPIHTLPDLLIAEYHAVEFRRAKYVAAWALDASLTRSVKLLGVREGSLTDGAFLLQAVIDDDLLATSLLREAGDVLAFDVALSNAASAPRAILEAGPGLNSTAPSSTYQPDLVAARVAAAANSSDSAVLFATAPDWRDRLWQFNDSINDRALDFRNFRDRQTSSVCPDLHHAVVIVFQECQRILEQDLRWGDAPSTTNSSLGKQSYARGMDTSAYEACIAVHDALRVRYRQCIARTIPSFASMREWDVNDRECVGGGGLCGPPPAGDDNTTPVTSGIARFNASTLVRMCVELPQLKSTRICNGSATYIPYQVHANRDLVAEDAAQKRFARFPPS